MRHGNRMVVKRNFVNLLRGEYASRFPSATKAIGSISSKRFMAQDAKGKSAIAAPANGRSSFFGASDLVFKEDFFVDALS